MYTIQQISICDVKNAFSTLHKLQLNQAWMFEYFTFYPLNYPLIIDQ